MKAVVDRESHLIPGAAKPGTEGGEIRSVFQVTMMRKLPYEELLYGVFALPTYAEFLNNLFMTIEGYGCRQIV
jgi:pyruvate/2-oxoglutarate dehydrogenase complex dihydrolipoamide dehydrogenase (E3) component